MNSSTILGSPDITKLGNDSFEWIKLNILHGLENILRIKDNCITFASLR